MLTLLCLILFCYGSVSAQSVQCLDHTGKPVDWWFIYKTGRTVSSTYKGYAFAYTDANTVSSGKWMTGDFNNSNAAYYTMTQIGLYGGEAGSDVGYGIWNDQTHWNLDGSCDDHYDDPNGYIYGHTKGTIGFDSNTGFWITHSAPGFPYDHSLCPTSWYFPYAQSIYGQNFMCVSIKASDVDRIGTYLQYYHAYVYDSNVPGSNMPNFQNFINMNFNQGHGTLTFTSLGGQAFQAWGKNQVTNSDLYEDYLAPGLNQNLAVECWCGGNFGDDCAPSYCQGSPISNPSTPQQGESTYPFSVITVEQLSFGSSYTFSTEYNHGKFALASSAPYYCASDINREVTQRKRGGGAVCTHLSSLWTMVNSAITQLNTTCSSETV